MSNLDSNKNGKIDRWETAKSRVSHRKAQLKYESTPIQVKKRVNRNKARAEMEKAGKVHKGDGKDVMHKDGNALHNSPINWKAGSRHKNRSYARDSKAHKADPRS